MNLLTFQNPYEFFHFFLRLKKKSGLNCATVSSITRKIIVCDMWNLVTKTSRIRDVMFIVQNLQKSFWP